MVVILGYMEIRMLPLAMYNWGTVRVYIIQEETIIAELI
jgi:hypothetical protein